MKSRALAREDRERELDGTGSYFVTHARRSEQYSDGSKDGRVEIADAKSTTWKLKKEF